MDIILYSVDTRKSGSTENSDTTRDKNKESRDSRFSEEDNDDEDESTTIRPRRTTTKAPIVKKPLSNIYNDSYQIKTETSLGVWSIRVRLNDDDDVVTQQRFKVEEYILPRFKVEVVSKSHVALREGSVKLLISGKYTFGEMVKGRAVITTKVYASGHPDIVLREITSQAYEIITTKEVEFNIKSDLKILNTIKPSDVEFNVTFTEDLTGQKNYKEVSVRIANVADYSLYLTRKQPKFKPGFPFQVQAFVRKFDGSHVTDDRDPIEIKVLFHLRPRKCSDKKISDILETTYEYSTETKLKNGKADIKLDVPGNATAFTMTAKFKHVQTTLNATRLESNTREYIFISLGGKK